MCPAQEDLESGNSRSVYWKRPKLHCRSHLERSFRLLDVDLPACHDLEPANTRRKKDQYLCCIRHWIPVCISLLNRPLRLIVSSACVATVARLVYTVKLLRAKDYTYVLDQLALWKYVLSTSLIFCDGPTLLNECSSGTEMTTIILCACMPTLPKSIQLFKGKHKKTSKYQQTPLNDANFRKSRGGGVVPRNLTATRSSWLESDDHEMQVVGDYQPLEGEQVTKPRPLSKIHSVIDPTCWGEPSASRDDSAGSRNNAIWKTVHIENSSDLKRASKPKPAATWQISP